MGLGARGRPIIRTGHRRGLVIAGTLLGLSPVVVRNYAVGGGLYLTTSQLGPNFYIGNNPTADGTYRPLRFGRGAAEFERLDATEIAERAAGRQLNPNEVSRYWMDARSTSSPRTRPRGSG